MSTPYQAKRLLNLPEFSSEQFERFRRLLQEKSGVFFDENKLNVMGAAVRERMATLELNDYNTYYRLLSEPTTTLNANNPGETPAPSSSHEMRRLVEELVVNETSFFRNREHYRALSQEVLPRLFRRKAKERRLRIWSAGCSTGQEPYSLAIAVIEALQANGQLFSSWQIEIIASDISERALQTAQAGRYRTDELRGLDDAQAQRYFRPLTAPNVATAPLDPAQIYQPGQPHTLRHRPRISYEVIPAIRNLIKFSFLNLTEPNYPPDKFSNFDLVLCENVTIYFAPETTRQVIDKLYATMNEGAFFFIGYSETLWQVSERFKLINTQDTFYYQKPFPNEIPSRYLRRQPSTGPLSAPADSARLSATEPPPGATASEILAEAIQRHRKTDPSLKLPALQRQEEKEKEKEKENKSVPDKDKPSQPTSGRKEAARSWQTQLSEGRQRMAQHDFERALTALESALQAGPHEVEVLCALAELKLKLGHYAAALELCREAILLNRLSEPAHLMTAMIFHKERRIEEAIREYKNTIYINSNAVIAYMRLADIYRDTGHQRDALREYKRALSVLEQKGPDEMIEDLSVGLLIQACRQNITRLSPRPPRQA